MNKVCNKALDDIKAAGTFKTEHTVIGAIDPVVKILGKDDVLTFCSNNYHGFNNNPRLQKVAHESLNTHGWGNAAARYVVGTTDRMKEFEECIAKFYGKEEALTLPSCYDANMGLFAALFDNKDAILTDEFNHASSIDGIRLCRAERHIFKHMDMASLEEGLKKTQHCRMRVIVTDGVFSMYGDFSPLKDIVKLAK